MTTSAEKTHLYEDVANKIARLIDLGTLKPGERIPSVRKLNAQMGVSVSTILQSYLLLEDRGLIEARPQSGFYVKLRTRALAPEPKMSSPNGAACRVGIGELAAEVHEALLSPDIVPLGAATPGMHLLPTVKLNKILASVARNNGQETNRYDLTLGNTELRRQIARRSLDWGCNFSVDEIVTTVGATEALNLCLRAITKPGDTVVVESPTYFGFLQILESLNLKALEISTHPRDGICLDALESAVKRQPVAACFIMSNFHNPLGSCMPEKNKKQLVDLMAKRGIPIIEDDVYGDLSFSNERPKTLKSYDKTGTVLLCSSFSKTLSPGYRVGWTAPGKFMQQVRRLKLVNTISTATLPQMAIAEMLQSGGYDRYLRSMRRSLASQVQVMTQAVAKYFPEGTKMTRPLGGFVLWVELPGSVDSVELYRKAMEKNISVVPGPMFSAKRQYKQFIRLNCGHPWSERIEQGLITIGRLAERMM